ncbi:FibroRumin system radical SAM peptide maturase [Coriobacteriales bacterium OH1046]|nr:FibroRumin system radical SAM peptide maturase [Coriobacteriales bacterium OH1046]
MEMSRFSYVFDLGDDVALYHSLRMKPVFLDKETYAHLKTWIDENDVNEENVPENLSDVVPELIKCKILVRSDDEDDRVLRFVRSRIPKPAINVCYMILSEQCNLACKYCFLGNNDAETRSEFLLESMSTATADKAIDFFIRQIKKSGFDFKENKPVLIFYGGEPLVNYSVLVHVASRINEMRDAEPCIKNLEMSMVTNGLLLNEERLVTLKELGVGIAISVDGFTDKANEMRVDVAGNPVFQRILEKLDLCKRLDIDVSLSVTLSEETLRSTTDVLALLDQYGIKGFGFNIMMSSESFTLPQSYNEAAAQFIIDEFVELRKQGIYEDRMMRKLKAFSKAQVYFSDCAATAGGQIVIAPNGQVGVCHGCLHNKRDFVSSIDDDGFIAVKDPTFIEWSQLTPLNREECYDCAALGICGGGCPVNAMTLKPGNTIHSIDERFCVHAKMTLDFLISDLHRIVVKNRVSR